MALPASMPININNNTQVFERTKMLLCMRICVWMAWGTVVDEGEDRNCYFEVKKEWKLGGFIEKVELDWG